MHCEEAAVLDAEIREGILRSDLDDGMDGHGLDDELEFCEYLQGYIEEGFPAIWKNLESYIIDALDPTFSLYGFGNLVMNAVFIRRRIGEGDENASVCYENLFRAWNEKDPAISSKTREILDGLDLETEWYEQEYEEPR